MTTLRAYSGTGEVIGQIRLLWRRRRLIRLATACCILAAAVCGVVITITLAVGYWPTEPPAALRWALLIGAIAVLATAAGAGLGRWALWRQNLAQNARHAETALGGLDNGLINTLHLSRDALADPVMVQAAIHEAADRLRAIDLGAAADTRYFKRSAWTAGVGFLAVTAMILLQGPRMGRALMTVLMPETYAPPIGSLRIEVDPGDAALYSGQVITITATVDNAEGTAYPAELFALGAGQEAFTRLSLTPDGDSRVYTHSLGVLSDNVKYYLRIGDTRMPQQLGKAYYTLTVQDRPQMRLLGTFTYPHYTCRYTGRKPTEKLRLTGPIEAPEGTKVHLAVQLDYPVAKAQLQFRNGRTAPMTDSLDRLTHTREIPLTAGGYRVVLAGASGHTIHQAPSGDRFYPIAAIPDAPPTISQPKALTTLKAVPGETLKLTFAAVDDYGLTGATLHFGRRDPSAETIDTFVPLRAIGIEGLQWREELTVTIPPDTPDGAVLAYYATVTDNYPLGPAHTPESFHYEIEVFRAATSEARRADRYRQLYQSLLALLKIQVEAREAHRVANKADTIDRFRALEMTVLSKQRGLCAATDTLLTTFPFAPEGLKSVQAQLAALRAAAMTDAVSQAEITAELPKLTYRPGASDQLALTQERVLRGLEAMLGRLSSVTRKADPEADGATGDDLPPQFREEAEALAEKMEELLAEQIKCIAAAERLAKKPVDEFTEDDQELLRELQAAQDKWEKFLNESFADFSKLAQQDFSNPSVLTELLSVKTDVTMAKDALSKEATEIATATDSMSAAGENAEELTANLEKWLPDTPDRTKWNMEDPGGQDNVEMPELPSELEDLVGDLLEEEGELFDEMADVTSTAADSFDKGVGWDAMDGPISSMNAQGVTGNQLPNPSEISGRSGEGRQGKSTGEFVEDKFVGKGGRRTPTRLTPEPFQQGQVNDQSTEPPGGSTGGGKISGAGGEGLEGPVPPPLKKELDRLAGQQAELINKAEKIGERFKVSNYGNFSLAESLILMRRVKSDLDHYRYRNALRRREAVIGSLRAGSDGAGEPFEVIRDTTGSSSKDFRQDAHDATQISPTGPYTEALIGYLDKLRGDNAYAPAQP